MNLKNIIIIALAVLAFLALVSSTFSSPSTPAEWRARADAASLENLHKPLKIEWFPKKENVDDKGIVAIRVRL